MRDSRVAGLETKNSRTSERGAQHHRKPRSFAQPFLARLSPTVADAPSGFTKVFDRTNCETCRRARNASPVAVIPGPEIDFPADPDQLEQMLNLIRNAADAVLQVQEVERHSNGSKSSDTDQQIVFSWKSAAEHVIISIQDNGLGLMNPANAFVPFYTTKPAGRGIGLVLSRQIAEAHGGSLELENRPDRQGCLVRITLPIEGVSNL